MPLACNRLEWRQSRRSAPTPLTIIVRPRTELPYLNFGQGGLLSAAHIYATKTHAPSLKAPVTIALIAWSQALTAAASWDAFLVNEGGDLADGLNAARVHLA